MSTWAYWTKQKKNESFWTNFSHTFFSSSSYKSTLFKFSRLFGPVSAALCLFINCVVAEKRKKKCHFAIWKLTLKRFAIVVTRRALRKSKWNYRSNEMLSWQSLERDIFSCFRLFLRNELGEKNRYKRSLQNSSLKFVAFDVYRLECCYSIPTFLQLLTHTKASLDVSNWCLSLLSDEWSDC